MPFATRRPLRMTLLASFLVLTGGWVVVPGEPALAQPMIFAGPGGGPGGRGGFDPPVTSRELEKYAAVLGLSAEQEESARTLLESMQAEFDAVAREARDAMDAARAEFEESRDPGVFQEKMPKAMRAMREKREQLEEGFLGDVKSLLDDDQASRWPEVERVRRRDHTLSRGSLSGEQVDLISLVQDMKLPEAQQAPVKPVLDQYELDLDRALIDRNQAYDARNRAMFGDGASFNMDPQRMQSDEMRKLSEEAKSAGMRVRDLNRRYVRQVAGLLPPDLAAKLESEFRRASFPTVYRETQASRSLAAALAFDDLTPEQRTSLDAMRAAYDREVTASNEKLASIIEADEARSDTSTFSFGGSKQVFRMRNGPDGDSTADPESEARSVRRKFDEKTLESLKSILTDPQRERLPKRIDRARVGSLGARPGVAAGEEADRESPSGNVAVGVVRRVATNEQGEAHEATEVWVAGDGEGDGGDGEEHEVVIVATPPASGQAAPAPAPAPAKPAPKPE